jgi:TatA/E family protein of Tat protein translocase
MQQHLLAIGMPGPLAWVVIAGIGLLVFGKRLPSVGKNLALGIRGFQAGLKDVGAVADDEESAQLAGEPQRKSLPDQR